MGCRYTPLSLAWCSGRNNCPYAVHHCSTSLVVIWKFEPVLSSSCLRFGYVTGKRAALGTSHFPWRSFTPALPAIPQAAAAVPGRTKLLVCSAASTTTPAFTWWVLWKPWHLWWLRAAVSLTSFENWLILIFQSVSVSWKTVSSFDVFSLHQHPTLFTPGCLTHRETFRYWLPLMQLLFWNGDLPELASAQRSIFLLSSEERLL